MTISEKTRRGFKEGIGFGVIAGGVLALVEVVAATLMGNPPLTPVRMFASVVAGEGALQATPLGSMVVLGVLVHLVLSALFGLVYGLANARLSSRTETSWNRQALIGLAYGALVWAFNFQLVARTYYPWFLDGPQLLQLVAHAVFFGLPLALMYAGAERKAQVVWGHEHSETV